MAPVRQLGSSGISPLYLEALDCACELMDHLQAVERSVATGNILARPVSGIGSQHHVITQRRGRRKLLIEGICLSLPVALAC